MVSHLLLQGLLLLRVGGVAGNKTHKYVGVSLQPAWQMTILVVPSPTGPKGVLRRVYDGISPV